MPLRNQNGGPPGGPRVRAAARPCRLGPSSVNGVTEMHIARFATAACLAVACVAAAVPASAHGPYRAGWRTSVTIGVGPVWVRPWPVAVPYAVPYAAPYAVPYAWDTWGAWGPWGPWGPWGAPAVVAAAPPPVVYVERADAPAADPSGGASGPPAGFWYWCADARGWYPAVPSCPSAWVAVPPRAAR